MRIGSVCIPNVRMGANKSPDVCVDTVLVPGGRIGALGDEGAEDGAWIAIEGIEIGAGGGALLGSSGVSIVACSGSVCVDVDTTWVSKMGERGGCVTGDIIVGVAGGLRGCSTVWTEVDVVEEGTRLTLSGAVGCSRAAETRFRRWFASMSALDDKASLDLLCKETSKVCDEDSTMVGRVGDGGGDGCTPLSTYIGLVGGNTNVISLGVNVVDEWTVSYEVFGASNSVIKEGSSLPIWWSIVSPRIRFAFSSGYIDCRDS
jgi:hypothetical protein